MGALILTILCSTSIALILKHNDSRSGNPLTLLCGNYFAATIIGAVFLAVRSGNQYSIESIAFGAVLAIGFVFSFFAFAKAVNAAGTALATVSSRISVIIPIAFSVIVFNEVPKPLHYAGFALVIVTIILFYFSLRNNGDKKISASGYIYLILLLAGIGINDFAMKVFESWRPETEKTIFIFSIFSFSFVYTFLIHLLRKIKIEKRAFGRGLILGIPNIFSSVFLIEALLVYDAITVYPIINIGIILLTTVLAMIIWREKLNLYAGLAILSGIGAILFLL